MLVVDETGDVKMGSHTVGVQRQYTGTAGRIENAGLGSDTASATKPELAARMITRFLDSCHQTPWVTGDGVYGGNPTLCAALEHRATCLLPLLLIRAGTPDSPGAGRGIQTEGRGDVPARKGFGRTGTSPPRPRRLDFVDLQR
ncbi:hypothetical protein ATP06_0228500 [Amycolatopsis regifaucium]|uniref:Transposase IS701-like DDE domain-containing protein n=1 Tax=Amycolatopsis regifaucium TaxID=546365 RepID=A0ABX3DLF1_9PSEU|nr:hypothetical protein ATP06_0228500 [Amycolatopsis regifaucium]